MLLLVFQAFFRFQDPKSAFMRLLDVAKEINQELFLHVSHFCCETGDVHVMRDIVPHFAASYFAKLYQTLPLRNMRVDRVCLSGKKTSDLLLGNVNCNIDRLYIFFL